MGQQITKDQQPSNHGGEELWDTSVIANSKLSKSTIVSRFHTACISQLSHLEQLSLARTFTELKLDIELGEEQFIIALGFPSDQPTLTRLIFGLFCILSRYPFIEDISTVKETVNLKDIQRCLVLLHKEKGEKVRGLKLEMLIFICLAISSSLENKAKIADDHPNGEHNSTFVNLIEKNGDDIEGIQQPEEEVFEVSFDNRGKIQWKEFPWLADLAECESGSWKLSTSYLLNLIAFLLILHQHDPVLQQISLLPFDEFSSYKLAALSLVKSMNLDITNENFKSTLVNWNDFETTIRECAPFLFDHVGKFAESYLYIHNIETENTSPEIEQEDKKKTMEPAVIAQISSMLPASTTWSASLHPLFAASKHGYSHRAFESKVINWNSPTLLYLKGTRISSGQQSNNKRYKAFEESYPKFRNAEELLSNQSNQDSISYAVYVEQPWRITNKETFGSKGTVIMQLSPHQRFFKVLEEKNLVYFNTNGGGISFGSPQPSIKTNGEVFHHPGRASMLIDSSLNFAIFHHLGPSSPFRSPDERLTYLEYEDRLKITSLEVWGCGGTKEIAEQNKKWEWERKERERRRYLNKESFNEDRALLEMAGLVGNFSPNGGSAA